MRKRTLAVALASFFLLGLATALFAGGQKEGSATSSSSTMSSNTAMSSTASSVPQGGEILGAGSSFAFPIYSKMGDEYNKITGTKLNYQSIGSSGGIKNITNKVVDFGASDAFLDDSQVSAMPAPIIQYPTVAGAIVITYNLPGNPTLKFTGDTIAKIWLGQITKWNDPAIAATNPGVTLPSQDIVVAHRSDGSGTTFNFTLYLSRVNSDWQSKVGYNTSVNWPVGLGGAQNAGVAGIVSQTPGAIGYVELAYATQNNLPFATLQNKAGNWIVPSLASTSAAANTQIPADGRIYLDNTDAPQGYPITTLTWIIVYKEQNYSGRTLEQAQRLANFLWWTVHDGQQYAEPLQYSKLPAAAVTADENIIKSMTYDGKPILNN